MIEAASRHRRVFTGMSKGGILLSNKNQYVRLDYDMKLISKINESKKDSMYKINSGAKYLFWLDGNDNDTLSCSKNTDTLTEFKLVYMIPPSNSNLNDNSNGIAIGSVFKNLFYSIANPLFYNAPGAMQILASCENIIIIVALTINLVGIFRFRDAFLSIVLVTICLFVCLLVSYAAPNSGAIFRYRSPAVVLMILGAGYFYKKKN